MAKKRLVRAKAAGFDPFPGLRQVNDPIVADALLAAQRYWDGKRVQRTDNPTEVYTAESLTAGGVDPRGRGTGPAYGSAESQIALRSDALGAWLARARDPRSTRRQQRRNVRRLYGALTHEEGHVRGIKAHSDEGPMQEAFSYRAAPGDWRVLMRELRDQGLIPHGRTPVKKSRRTVRKSRPSNYDSG